MGKMYFFFFFSLNIWNRKATFDTRVNLWLKMAVSAITNHLWGLTFLFIFFICPLLTVFISPGVCAFHITAVGSAISYMFVVTNNCKRKIKKKTTSSNYLSFLETAQLELNRVLFQTMLSLRTQAKLGISYQKILNEY